MFDNWILYLIYIYILEFFLLFIIYFIVFVIVSNFCIYGCYCHKYQNDPSIKYLYEETFHSAAYCI